MRFRSLLLLFFFLPCLACVPDTRPASPSDPGSRSAPLTSFALFPQQPLKPIGKAPPMLPSAPSSVPAEWIDHLTPILSCSTKEDTIFIPRLQIQPPACSLIHLEAAWTNLDGDTYEGGVDMQWTVSDPSRMQLLFPFGSKAEFAIPETWADLFDMPGYEEPTLPFMGCALNACPAQPATTCQPMVCATAKVVSVINLEGNWIFSGKTFEESPSGDISQNGRNFTVSGLDGKYGYAYLDILQFRRNDALYQGILLPDRTTILGHVWDLLNDDLIGEWSAHRPLPLIPPTSLAGGIFVALAEDDEDVYTRRTI